MDAELFVKVFIWSLIAVQVLLVIMVLFWPSTAPPFGFCQDATRAVHAGRNIDAIITLMC